ncbi:MAG: hypothetical protein A3F68_00175 [Acidobacteria bacterium RIFCSPLOWO2_12_FULL_54_10]|nr:MAG: hypothetical protein A3F68_00175 [Acidobacteria bacterium RIFCSPLOWO2_12_FULL_54_10]
MVDVMEHFNVYRTANVKFMDDVDQSPSAANCKEVSGRFLNDIYMSFRVTARTKKPTAQNACRGYQICPLAV